MPTQDDILKALRAVKYPGYSRDIVSFGLVKNVAVNHGAVSVLLELTSATPEHLRQIKEEAERVLKELPGISALHVEVRSAGGGKTLAESARAQPNKIPRNGPNNSGARGEGGV